jgi:hypothetical protein
MSLKKLFLFFKGKNFANKNYERVKLFFPALVSSYTGREIFARSWQQWGI